MATIVEIIIKAADQTKSGFQQPIKSAGDLEKALTRVAPAAKFAAVAVAGAVAAMTKLSIDAADEMSKAAQKIGLTTEGLSKLKYAAEDLSGVQGLEGALAKLNRTMVEGAEAFKRAGVAIKDSSGNIRNTEAVLMDIADVMRSMPDGAEKTALAMDLFGKSGQELIPFLNGGSEAIREMTEEAKALGLEISSKTGKEAEQFNDNITRLEASGKGFSNMMAAEFLPVLVQLSNEMVESVKQGGLMKQMFEGVSFVVKVLGSGLLMTVTTIREAILGISNLAALITTFAKDGRKAAGELAVSMADEFENRRQATLVALANLWLPEGANVTPEKAGRQAGIDYLAGAADSIQKEQAKLVAVIVSTFQNDANITKATNGILQKQLDIDLARGRTSLEQYYIMKAELAKNTAQAELDALDIVAQARERDIPKAGSGDYDSKREAHRKALEDIKIAERAHSTELEGLALEREKAIKARNAQKIDDERALYEVRNDAIDQEGRAIEGAHQMERDWDAEKRQMAEEWDLTGLERFENERLRAEEHHQEELKRIAELGLAEEEALRMTEQARRAHNARLSNIDKQQITFERNMQMDKYQAMGNMLGAFSNLSAQFGKKGLATSKALAIAQAVINMHLGAARALADWPWPMSLVVAATVAAQGAMEISAIKSAGQAHAGMDYIPREGSYVLQRGEMVLDPGTSESVRQAAKSRAGGGGVASGTAAGQSGGFMADVYLDGQKVGRALMKLAQNGQLTLPKMAIV